MHDFSKFKEKCKVKNVHDFSKFKEKCKVCLDPVLDPVSGPCSRTLFGTLFQETGSRTGGAGSMPYIGHALSAHGAVRTPGTLPAPPGTQQPVLNECR